MSETDGDAPEAIEPPSGTPPAADGGDRSTGWGTQGPWSTPPAGEAPSGGSQPPPGYGQPPPGYGQPPPGYGQPPPGYGYGYGYGSGYGYASPPPFAKPANNLVSAILATVLCCLPLGVVAIVFASQVDTKWASGDWYGAQDSAKKAKLFANLSVAGAVVGIVLYIFVIAMTGTSTRRY